MATLHIVLELMLLASAVDVSPDRIEALRAKGVEVQPAAIVPIEERGDSMLFDGAALAGTPFTEAVVLPFEKF